MFVLFFVVQDSLGLHFEGIPFEKNFFFIRFFVFVFLDLRASERVPDEISKYSSKFFLFFLTKTNRLLTFSILSFCGFSDIPEQDFEGKLRNSFISYFVSYLNEMLTNIRFFFFVAQGTYFEDQLHFESIKFFFFISLNVSN
jgi:hypothetical protein